MDTKRVGTPGTSAASQLDRPTDVRQTDGVQKSTQKKGAKGTQKSDFDVALSPQAREMADAREKAMQIAKATSPVREDRVAELKQKIQNGTYQIDSDKIADGIMREAVLDQLANMPDE